MTTSTDHHVIDIEKISTSIANELELLHPLSDECCIYRVPKAWRCINEAAYSPTVVSIGPFHHEKPELKLMEEQKRRYLQDFLQLSSVSVKNFVNTIMENETKIRNCYAETIEFNSEEFVKMMLIDAAFIIMVLLKSSYRNLRSSNDRIFYKPWMENDVRYDMLLLENQIPFFILNDLYHQSNIPNKVQEGLPLIKLARAFFRGKWGFWVTSEVLEMQNLSDEVVHLLGFIRICQKPSKWEVQKRISEPVSFYAPTATELHQAGVKFKLSNSRKKLDIEFKNGVLHIPLMKITQRTECFLKNIQAFEQCHCDNKYINSYIAFITMLVKTPKDVEILIQSGILQTRRWNNDSLSTLFHHLGSGNFDSHKNFHFSGLVEDLNLYCGKSWHNWKATLKQQYFNNPWVGISVIAACVLLILTIIQTVCSLLQV